MYIKNSESRAIFNFDRFDGLLTEEYDDSLCRLCLFRAEGEKGFGKLRKYTVCIGAFSREQTSRIIGEIEESLKNRETMYVLPEPEAEE